MKSGRICASASRYLPGTVRHGTSRYVTHIISNSLFQRICFNTLIDQMLPRHPPAEPRRIPFSPSTTQKSTSTNQNDRSLPTRHFHFSSTSLTYQYPSPIHPAMRRNSPKIPIPKSDIQTTYTTSNPNRSNFSASHHHQHVMKEEARNQPINPAPDRTTDQFSTAAACSFTDPASSAAISSQP